MTQWYCDTIAGGGVSLLIVKGAAGHKDWSSSKGRQTLMKDSEASHLSIQFKKPKKANLRDRREITPKSSIGLVTDSRDFEATVCSVLMAYLSGFLLLPISFDIESRPHCI